MEYSKQGHCVYYARYHIVLATRYRRKVLKEGMGEYLKRTLRAVARHYPEIQILKAETDVDHLHMLVSIPPKMAVSEVIRIIKSNTGTAMRKRFKYLDYVYFGAGGIWSAGYFVSTVGINEEVIRNYLELQGREDRGQAQLEIKEF